jgi:hypothetical protein
VPVIFRPATGAPGERRPARSARGAQAPTARYGGVRLRRGAGHRRDGQRPAPVRYRARGRRARLPRHLRRDSPHPLVALARHFPACQRPSVHALRTLRARPESVGVARRRCALDDREENPHTIGMAVGMAVVGSARRRPGCGYSGQSNRAQMVRVVLSPSIPHSSATARTMSNPWCRVGSIIPWFHGPPLSWTSIRA